MYSLSFQCLAILGTALFAAEGAPPDTETLDRACDVLFEQVHHMSIRVHTLDESSANIRFFHSGPGVEITGEVIGSGDAPEYVVRLVVPQKHVPSTGLDIGSVVSLNVLLISVEQAFDHTVLVGRVTGPAEVARAAPLRADVPDIPARAGELPVGTLAVIVSEALDDESVKVESDTESPAESQEDRPVKTSREGRPNALEPALRNWERDVVRSLKLDEPIPPPPLLADQTFQCTLRLPKSYDGNATIAAAGFNARTLSQKNVLTRNEQASLAYVGEELDRKLFEAKHIVRLRKDWKHQDQIRELRAEGRELLAQADRRIADAPHIVILSNPELLPWTKGRKTYKCLLQIDVVSLEEHGRLPTLVIEGAITE